MQPCIFYFICFIYSPLPLPPRGAGALGPMWNLGHAPVPASSYLLRAQLPGPLYFNHLIFFDSCFPEKCIFNDLPLGLKAQQKHFDMHLKLHLFSGTIDFNYQPTSPPSAPRGFFQNTYF